jgi:hypothetical protein
MKKKLLIGIAAAAVATIAAVNVNYALQGNDLSELSLANVEALAQEEIVRDTTRIKRETYETITSNVPEKVCIRPGSSC